jgi:YVTN family beta-propeller protein
MGKRITTCAALLGTVLAGVALSPSAPKGASANGLPDEAPRPSLRRPLALATADGGKWLFVANRQSGSVSVIDTSSLRVVAEVPVGKKLSDLTVTPDGGHLLVTDEGAGELVVLRRRDARLQTPLRVKVGAGPVSSQVSADGSYCSVVSLWPRRVTIVGLPRPEGDRQDPPEELHVRKSLTLAFPPRLQLLLRDPAKLIVADSFGGRLAVIDPTRGEVESDRLLPAHNIRGLAPSADGTRLLVSHQLLRSLGTTSRDDIHWGNFLTNCLRELSLASVLDPRADLLRGSRLHHLGDVGRGAGDPAGVAALPEGKAVVALAGVGEVAIGGGTEGSWQRVSVGRQPTAVALSPDRRRAYVANTLADSITILDLGTNRVQAEVSLGPAAELTRADRGERLFHDARLSHDGWFSCHSCHTDGHSNGLLADTLGDGSYGTPKRVLSLLGVGDTGPWAWNGSVKELEAQIRLSVETTMRGARLSPEQEGDLAAYLRTLPPAPPLGRLREKPDGDAVRRGRAVFERQNCGSCHAQPTYTSAKTYDVGLSDEAGNRSFNPPSLRGASQTGTFFHDSRATGLAEVFTRHRHQLKGELSKQELDDLIAFLEDL